MAKKAPVENVVIREISWHKELLPGARRTRLCRVEESCAILGTFVCICVGRYVPKTNRGSLA